MKFSIDIECTPEEARDFLGLPDVSELQKQMQQAIMGKMKDNLAAFEQDSPYSKSMQENMANWQELQMMMWRQIQDNVSTMAQNTRTDSPDKDGG